MQPQYKVAAVLTALGAAVENMGLNAHQLRTLGALRRCRTAALGGHVDGCTACGKILISYNSCRNRHCPGCQGHKRQEWIAARTAELLAVPYYHVVFTLPAELNTLAMHKPKVVYDALFSAAWQTINAFAKQQKLQAGMISILHTWGQQLSLHPHLNCIVPGAGADAQGKLQLLSGRGKYLFPVKAMSKMYRAKYVAALRRAGVADKKLFDRLFAKPWVVYAKRPFGNTHAVIEYLGRYTHKVAISNHRLTAVTKNEVAFAYKDYKAGGTKKTMTLTPAEFIRRFAQHILPHRFVRIRHYGMLSSTWKRGKLQAFIQQKPAAQTAATPVGTRLHKCPFCKTGTLITLEIFDRRGPPEEYVLRAQQNSTCA